MIVEFDFNANDELEVDASLENKETGMIDYVLLKGDWVDCLTGEVLTLH